MVHGIEGLNRSAAVLMAFLMSMSNCLLEDAFVYMKTLRPHLCLDQGSVDLNFPPFPKPYSLVNMHFLIAFDVDFIFFAKRWVAKY